MNSLKNNSNINLNFTSPEEYRKIFKSHLNSLPQDKRDHYIDYFFINPNKKWHKFHIVTPSAWPFFYL